ncbi:MAG: recombinase family protein [Aestuariibacter sp.]|nr:recombinase family protein [Aestuariibacter sp.]
MKTAIEYQRTSTLKQDISPDVQQKKNEAMAVLKDLEIVDVIQDLGCSAKDLERPGIQRVIGIIQNSEVDAILVAKLDRLTRNVRDLYYLMDLVKESKTDLISADGTLDTSSAMGRAILGFRGVISQWERETIGERTREALQVKLNKPQPEKLGGRRPFGYDVIEIGGVKTLNGNHFEQRMIDEMCALRAVGNSYTDIAKMMNDLQVATVTGADWTSSTISAIIKRNS